MEEMRPHPIVKIAGVCGPLQQAIQEAELASKLGYDAALLSLAALKNATISELIAHAQAIASVIPVIGFYLQPAVGGRPLPLEFWAQFAEIQNVVAIKIAPFNRYQTLDVVRGVIAAGRANQIPLYTGNDDNILFDLLSEFNFAGQRLRIVGGLLGHWAVWASVAVSHLKRIRQIVNTNQNIPPDLLTLAWQVTDANAALFDAANGFHGCIAGIHEVLRRQGLLAGRWLLDPKEDLSPGQSQEIDRICTLYPHLQDNHFIEANLAAWLS
jgi:hypothetical protein